MLPPSIRTIHPIETQIANSLCLVYLICRPLVIDHSNRVLFIFIQKSDKIGGLTNCVCGGEGHLGSVRGEGGPSCKGGGVQCAEV